MLVNLHIIGVQKAGTTALATFLNQHPAVHVVKGKEAHVFDHPHYIAADDKHAFAHNKYQEKLKQHQQQRIVCDATPITLFNQSFLRDCFQYNPQAKFIVVLRDPVERAISHFYMTKSRHLEPLSMFWAFILEPLRMRGLKRQTSWDFDSPYRNQSYLTRGHYCRQLRELYKIVPSHQVLVLHQRELKNNHAAVMLQIFEFLDIQRHDIQPQSIFSTPKPVSRTSDVLAKVWAKLYFFVLRETPRRWNKIIKQALQDL